MVKLENLEKRLGRPLRDNSDIQSSGSTKLWERTPGKPEDINKHKKWTCNEKKNTNEFRCERGFKTGGVKEPEDNVEYEDQ